MIPRGQYLAQLAHPVHRLSYQVNSSPRNLGCCGRVSTIVSSPIKDLMLLIGLAAINAKALLSLIFARSNGLAFRFGYWCTLNCRPGETRFFIVIPRPLNKPIPYISCINLLPCLQVGKARVSDVQIFYVREH